MSILRVNNLSVSFRVGDQVIEAVKNVSFEIERGEIFALVGESGAGKSATALSLMRLLPQKRAFFPNGSILFHDRELIDAPDSTLQKIRGNDISMIFQEPMTSLNPLHTIEKQISESFLLRHNLSRQEARQKALELLHIVQLSEAEERLGAYPHQLSGGQRQRVMIAMALANNPRLLIADEPTTALDVTVQEEILDLLKDLKSRFDMSMLLITHDLVVVRRMADRVGVMKGGEIVELGERDKIFQNPTHAYTRYLIASELEEGIVKIPDKKVEVVRTENLCVAFPVYKGLFRRIKGFIRAVNGISVTVHQGQTLGLVGESGSGKTTFGLALLRLIKSRGSIRFMGQEIESLRGKTLRPLRKEMQIIFQDPFESLNPRLTVGQIIEEGIRVHNIERTGKEREELIHDALREVGLEPGMINRYPHEFSGGQRQRICIARVLVLKPSFLVLDEPTSSLDMSVQTQILELLKDLQIRYNLAYLFISHDLRVIRFLSHKIMVMKEGSIVEFGSSEKIFHDPKHPYTKQLIKAAFA